jgi:hypothetical protein
MIACICDLVKHGGWSHNIWEELRREIASACRISCESDEASGDESEDGSEDESEDEDEDEDDEDDENEDESAESDSEGHDREDMESAVGTTTDGQDGGIDIPFSLPARTSWVAPSH